MSKCEPWHSLAENVHHAWDDCATGRKLPAPAGTYRVGTGDRPLCSVCAELLRAAAAVQRVRETAPPVER
jgi:hypothetical protein